MDAQESFDRLVETAERWLLSGGFSAEERELAEILERARAADEGVADAALLVAMKRVDPTVEWR